MPAGLESFYEQSIDWYPCAKEGGMTEDPKETGPGSTSCARISVPLDYSNPEGATIEIALKRRSASNGNPIGSLFINPGGPGGSGVELVQNAPGYFSDALLESYDVIGFDPRGVGSSTAVDCLTDAELDVERAGENETAPGDTTAAEAQADVAQGAQEREAQCQSRTTTPGLLDHIDTISAARDLDIMRALVGDNLLSYLGFSYGTYLGATYADLFPGNVGRMVLDGAVDPSLSAGELTLGQAEAFESSLRTYVEDCQAGRGCPLTGDVDSGIKQIQDFLETTRTNPVSTSDPQRPLTHSLAFSAVLGILYQPESWSYLTQGLDQAMNEDDGSTLLFIADFFASRSEDGTYEGNGDEVISAINCLDNPVTGDAASWEQEADELEKASPTFGSEFAYSDLYCQAWGHESTRERTEIHASGAAPILVVGTTGDPATPYAWSEALAAQLDSGQLLTWEGEGHTAYGRAGKCVTGAVDTYLLTGEMPQEGLRCVGSQ